MVHQPFGRTNYGLTPPLDYFWGTPPRQNKNCGHQVKGQIEVIVIVILVVIVQVQ